EARKRPEVLRLMTHPGVGPITALAFVLVLGSPDRFGCGHQIGSYLGLIPCEDSSADRQRLGHITKQGSSLLRFLLVEAAQAAVRWDPDWRRRFVHLAMRRDRRIAKVAMARKLAVSLYWMWRKECDYQQNFAVRFARGRAWIRPWCEVNHRPLDWVSRSLSREFEVVIMVERAIGEMVGSDRIPPERLHANLCRR
ncbi:transposase, partial [Edaphobacter aggregans]|uniref:transposase n=1 Tax=Edaphobacter aggregans TaxID=570835 RepID=UPI0012FCEFA6